jgi:hypothetical protein
MIGLIVAMTTVATGVLWAVQASYSPSGTLDATPPQAFYLFIIIGSCATVGDLRLILRGHISGVPQLSRHLWRTCVALLIASASFFLGQQRVMPAWMRGSPLLFVPTFAPLLVMVYCGVPVPQNRAISEKSARLASVTRSDIPRMSFSSCPVTLAGETSLGSSRKKPLESVIVVVGEFDVSSAD